MRRVVPLLALTVAATAWAQSRKYPPEPVDKDQELADRSKLWDNATNPNSSPYADLIADAKQALGDRAGDDALRYAVDKLDQAIALQPDEYEAYALRGAGYMELQQWAKCADDLQTAIAKATREDLVDRRVAIEQRRKLGLCQARSGKLADAERTLSEAAATGTGTGEMLMRLGEVRIAMGKLDEAISALTAALDAGDPSSVGLTRWLLAAAYDRARRPAAAREAARDAAKTETRFDSLRTPRVPLLGVGEIEYMLGLAWEANEPARAEYALVYFRKFLRLAPDSPWRKRAEDHLRELKTTVLPEIVERRAGGVAAVDLDAARAIARKQMPAMRACLAKVPNQAIEVKITRSGPRSPAPKPPPRSDPFTRSRYRPPLPPAPPPDGVAVVSSSELPLEATRADIDAAARCVDPIASKLAMPAVKEKDAWYQISFLVVAP